LFIFHAEAKVEAGMGKRHGDGRISTRGARLELRESAASDPKSNLFFRFKLDIKLLVMMNLDDNSITQNWNHFRSSFTREARKQRMSQRRLCRFPLARIKKETSWDHMHSNHLFLRFNPKIFALVCM
jgi:hypothetical protein